MFSPIFEGVTDRANTKKSQRRGNSGWTQKCLMISGPLVADAERRKSLLTFYYTYLPSSLINRRKRDIDLDTTTFERLLGSSNILLSVAVCVSSFLRNSEETDDQILSSVFVYTSC